MSVADRQKDHERFLLKRFIEAATLSAAIVEHREAPDFIVSVEGCPVGVEVTELFIPHGADRGPKQAQESISTRIVSRARALYRNPAHRPSQVTVLFCPGSDLQNLPRDSTAARLVSFTESIDRD